MTKFRNMKIEITEDQPLDEVVRELERLGCINNQFYFHISDHNEISNFKSIACYESGSLYYNSIDTDLIYGCNLTTLAELKEM